jgi:hypothetical protein
MRPNTARLIDASIHELARRPINICPVLRGWRLNATDSVVIEWRSRNGKPTSRCRQTWRDAIRDGEVTLARHDRQLRRELGRARTSPFTTTSARIVSPARVRTVKDLDRRTRTPSRSRAARSRYDEATERRAGRITTESLEREAPQPAPRWLGDLEIA